MFADLESAYNSLRELEQLKSNFLATISHELRTPLTAINGYLQLLLGNRIGPLSAGQKEVLERIHTHGDLLTGKVNDLIEIAEIESGRGAETVIEPVDPLGAIMNALPRVESRRMHKGITVEPLVSASIPKILANPTALERIFFHLIDNAIKFSHPQGHVWIEFETVGGELHVKIVDNGIGISQNQLKKIFDSFYQVDNQLTRNYEGLGIGLTVTKKQLDTTHGRISVESQLHKGSVFTVIYPIAPGE
jgi:signal transduction histidine kinase